MKSYLVDVRIADDLNHVVAGKRVTVPEIALLRAIHGAGAVFNIRTPVEVDDYSEDAERLRLTAIYDTKPRDEGGGLMERLFGLQARLPLTLKDIGIDAKAAAKAAEKAAAEATARAAELAAEAEADAQADAAAAAADEAFS